MRIVLALLLSGCTIDRIGPEFHARPDYDACSLAGGVVGMVVTKNPIAFTVGVMGHSIGNAVDHITSRTL